VRRKAWATTVLFKKEGRERWCFGEKTVAVARKGKGEGVTTHRTPRIRDHGHCRKEMRRFRPRGREREGGTKKKGDNKCSRWT